jgi:hypothetical protein
METPEESGAGYPEEQPSEVADEPSERTPQREGGRPDTSAAPHADEGTATGNPHDAGSTDPDAERGDPPG